MWPAGTLLFSLPPHLLALENEHFFALVCRRCGQTVATFTLAGAQPKAILQAARAHQCPKPAPRRCGRCGVEVHKDAAKCPNCGEWLLLG